MFYWRHSFHWCISTFPSYFHVHKRVNCHCFTAPPSKSHTGADTCVQFVDEVAKNSAWTCAWVH
jgi:hypothetical protein